MQKVEIKSVSYDQPPPEQEDDSYGGGFAQYAQRGAPRIKSMGKMMKKSAAPMRRGMAAPQMLSAAPQMRSMAAAPQSQMRSMGAKPQMLSMAAAPQQMRSKAAAAPQQKSGGLMSSLGGMFKSKAKAAPQEDMMMMKESAPERNMMMMKESAPVRKMMMMERAASSEIDEIGCAASSEDEDECAASSEDELQCFSAISAAPKQNMKMARRRSSSGDRGGILEDECMADNFLSSSAALEQISDPVEAMAMNKKAMVMNKKAMAISEEEEDDELQEELQQLESNDMMMDCAMPPQMMEMQSAMPMAPQMQMQAAPQKPPAPKPTFDSLIKGQDSGGFWTVQEGTALIKYLESGSQLQAYINANKDIETVILTLLALFLLEANFEDNADEWDMISSKAKKWIRQQNLTPQKKKEIENKINDCNMTDEDQLAAMMAI